MRLMLIVDDNNGISFAGKRLSKDKALINDIVESIGKAHLYIDKSSEALFKEYLDRKSVRYNPHIHVLDNIMDYMRSHKYCRSYFFVEKEVPEHFHSGIRQVILYKWNRLYPSDIRLNTQVLKRYRMIHSSDFMGTSHDTLTKEVYNRSIL